MKLVESAVHRSADGFVLAGGRSSRMGQDKSLIRFNGERLIEHALRTLRSAGFEPRIAGARSELSSFASIVPDDSDCAGLGPLSGICSALEAATARYALFLPVDLPLLPPSLVRYLVHYAEVTGSAITMASRGGFVETFPVVIDRAASAGLSRQLRKENRKCLSAFRAAAKMLTMPVSVVPAELILQAGQVSDPHDLPVGAWFLSINTPQDLSRVEGLLRRRVQLS